MQNSNNGNRPLLAEQQMHLAHELAFLKLSLESALKNNLSLLQFKYHSEQGNLTSRQSEIKMEEAATLKVFPNEEQEHEVKEEVSLLGDEHIFVEQKRVRNIHQKKNTPSGNQNDINQTKNIPKNYGKAILSYIQRNVHKHIDLLLPILAKDNLTVADLLIYIKKHKREVNSINYLKLIWGYKDQHNPIYKCIRILSFVFLRKHCLPYIFNSRVKNHMTHIKYRTKIIQGLFNPEEFTSIKQL